MYNKYLNSSMSDEWETPQYLFDQLNDEFQFTLDPCASSDNFKVKKYYNKYEDGLTRSWEDEVVFCNPPYSNIKEWVKKAFEESYFHDATVVLLIPARTDTSYFHDYILNKHEIRFIRGRLKFSGSKYNAPFPSMIVIMRPYYYE